MVVLLCLYAVSLVAGVWFVLSTTWRWARIMLVAMPAILSCILLADLALRSHADTAFAGFDGVALTVSVPLLGLGLMALFVAHWRWLFWLAVVLNLLAGAAVFCLALLFR